MSGAATPAQIAVLRERIRLQAGPPHGDGWEREWVDLPVPDEVRPDGWLRVPRAPFELWAVHRSGGEGLVAPWEIVSPRGLKQGGDDPYHTDWMLGAGLEPGDMRPSGGNPHWEALRDAAYAAAAEVQMRALGFRTAVILPGSAVTGRVHRAPSNPRMAADLLARGNLWGRWDEPPVLVLPDLRAEWADVVRDCLDRGGAVVCERGGEAAHLVSLMRGEDRGPILRLDRALSVLPSGGLLLVDASAGALRLLEDPAAGPPEGGELPPEPTPPRPPAPPVRSAGDGDVPPWSEAREGDGEHPCERTRFMDVHGAHKVEGRDWDVRVVPHWEHETFARSPSGVNTGWAEVMLFPRGRGGRTPVRRAYAGPIQEKASIPSGFVAWMRPGFGEVAADAGSVMRRLGRAVLEALEPAEAHDSPESQAAREAHRARRLAWVERSHGHLTEAGLEQRARDAANELLDALEAMGEWGSAETAEDLIDDAAAARHALANVDLELSRRGVPPVSDGILARESERRAAEGPPPPPSP